MPVTSGYKINTRNAVVGTLYGLSLTNSVRHTGINVSNAPIGMGLALQHTPTAEADRGVSVGTGLSADGGNVYALSIRQINKQMGLYSTTGEITYPVNAELTTLLDGFCHVEVDAAPDLTSSKSVYVHAANGTFHTTKVAGSYLAANMNWVTGDIGNTDGKVIAVVSLRREEA